MLLDYIGWASGAASSNQTGAQEKARSSALWLTIVSEFREPAAPACLLGTRHEQPLQNVPLDRLLQDRDVGKSTVDAFRIIASHEHKRHAAGGQHLGDRIDQIATKIDVQNGRIQLIQPCSDQRV